MPNPVQRGSSLLILILLAGLVTTACGNETVTAIPANGAVPACTVEGLLPVKCGPAPDRPTATPRPASPAAPGFFPVPATVLAGGTPPAGVATPLPTSSNPTIAAARSTLQAATVQATLRPPTLPPPTFAIPAGTNRPALPVNTGPVPLARDEQEVTFTSGKNVLYATMLLPPAPPGQKLPVALLLAGSGPTDRNGNNAALAGQVNSQLNFARALANQGVASLRYDKLGSGKTGLGSYISSPGDINFTIFLEEAFAAYDYLRKRPEIEPGRIMILGHDEGSLIALIVANQLKTARPKALVLAAPYSRPYLETVRRQVQAQYARSLQNGQVSQEQHDAALAEVERIIKSVQETGHSPANITVPALKQTFNPLNDKFITQLTQYDPASLAAGLPPAMPVLALCGLKDQQTQCADTPVLMDGFRKAGNSRAVYAELNNVNHVFKEVSGEPAGVLDYVNPTLKFSGEAVEKIAGFVKANL